MNAGASPSFISRVAENAQNLRLFRWERLSAKGVKMIDNIAIWQHCGNSDDAEVIVEIRERSGHEADSKDLHPGWINILHVDPFP